MVIMEKYFQCAKKSNCHFDIPHLVKLSFKNEHKNKDILQEMKTK